MVSVILPQDSRPSQLAENILIKKNCVFINPQPNMDNDSIIQISNEIKFSIY